MLITLLVLILVIVIALNSTVHALGIWVVMLITHTLIVQYVGDVATHLPMYAGVLIVVIKYFKMELTSIDVKMLGLFSLLLLLMTVSAMLGIDQDSSISVISLYAKGFFLAIIIASLAKTVKSIEILSIYCCASLVFGACVTLYNYFSGQFINVGAAVERVTSLRGDPNDTAMLLLAGLSLSLYWAYNFRSNVLRFSAISSIALIATAIVLTGSRGGFLTLIVVAIALYLKRPTLTKAIYGVIIALTIVAITPQSYWERIASLTTGEEVHGGKSLESRFDFLRQGTIMFIEHPVVGISPGNFPKALANATNKNSGASNIVSSNDRSSEHVAHNMYLEFFVENGIFAGAVFLFILMTALTNLLKFDRYLVKIGSSQEFQLGYCLALSIFAMLFAGLFLSQGKNSVLWFLIGISFSAAALSKRSS